MKKKKPSQQEEDLSTVLQNICYRLNIPFAEYDLDRTLLKVIVENDKLTEDSVTKLTFVYDSLIEKFWDLKKDKPLKGLSISQIYGQFYHLLETKDLYEGGDLELP